MARVNYIFAFIFGERIGLELQYHITSVVVSGVFMRRHPLATFDV